MQEWKNPLFQTGGAGERSLSGGVAQSSTSGLSDSFCAPYRPSPVPLRTIGDVVASVGKVQAVKVAPTTKPTNHPVLRVRYRKSGSSGGGEVYDSSICLPSGDVIPTTTNMLAENGLQWTSHTPPWHRDEDESHVPGTAPAEYAHTPPQQQHKHSAPRSKRTPPQQKQRRSSSQSIRDRLNTFARSFRQSSRAPSERRAPSGRISDSVAQGADDDHVRFSCFRRSDGSISSTTSNALRPVTRSFRRGLSRISNMGSTPDVAAMDRRATTPDTIQSTPLAKPSRQVRSTISSVTSYRSADALRSSDGGAVPSASTAPAVPTSFTFTTPRKNERDASTSAAQSPRLADVFQDKVSYAGNTPSDSVSPSRIAAQRTVKDSTFGSAAEQSLHLRSRVPSASQVCSPEQVSPCDSLSGLAADDDVENATQLLRDAYASEMGYSTQLRRGVNEIGNPTQLLRDAYGSDMSFALSGRIGGASRQLNRLGMRDGAKVGLKTPRELRTAAVRRDRTDDSCSILLPDAAAESGQLGESPANSGDVAGAQSAGVRLRQKGLHTPSNSSVSVPLKSAAHRKRQQHRRTEWTQAHASGVWHGRTLADFNQLSKEWQNLKTNIGTAHSRTISPPRIRPPKGASGNTQSVRLSVSRARRRAQDAEPSDELAQDSAQLHPDTGYANSPDQKRSKSLGSRATRASLRQNLAAAREGLSGPRNTIAAARVGHNNPTLTPTKVTNPRTRPFVDRTGPRNTEKSSGPTSLPTRSTRTSDYMDSTRRQSYASKDIKPKQSSPRLIDARFDDVRCANTAMKRVGRDPRPRRARISPEPRSDVKGFGSSWKGAAELRQPALQKTRPGSAVRTPLGVRDTRQSVDQMKPAAQSSKPTVGRSSLSAMQGRALHTGTGAGCLNPSTGVSSPRGSRCRAETSKRTFSRGARERGVWR